MSCSAENQIIFSKANSFCCPCSKISITEWCEDFNDITNTTTFFQGNGAHISATIFNNTPIRQGSARADLDVIINGNAAAGERVESGSAITITVRSLNTLAIRSISNEVPPVSGRICFKQYKKVL